MRRQTPAPDRLRKKRAHFEVRQHAPVKNWSYSAWEMYSTCALQYKFRYINKLKVPPHPAMERGNRVHQSAEDFLNNKSMGVTVELEDWSSRLSDIRAQDAVAEQPWAFDPKWQVVSWDSRDAWLRMKLDARVDHEGHIEVIDFKTGRIYDKHMEQGELYALGTMLRTPEVKTVDVEFWYIDQNRIERHEYSADEQAALVDKWTRRAQRMAKDSHFLPNPDQHCRWCFFSAAKGGPCKHGTRYA